MRHLKQSNCLEKAEKDMSYRAVRICFQGEIGCWTCRLVHLSSCSAEFIVQCEHWKQWVTTRKKWNLKHACRTTTLLYCLAKAGHASHPCFLGSSCGTFCGGVALVAQLSEVCSLGHCGLRAGGGHGQQAGRCDERWEQQAGSWQWTGGVVRLFKKN